MRRIVIIGSSGAGKSVLARQLAEKLGIPRIELDSLHSEPNWVEAPNEVMRERVAEAIAGETWVVDGNYAMVRDLVWSRADTVIWLDYSFPLVFWRTWVRTLRRSLRREALWSGNRESLRKAFLTRDSILLWVITTFRSRRREYEGVFGRGEFPLLRVHRLRRPRETASFG